MKNHTFPSLFQPRPCVSARHTYRSLRVFPHAIRIAARISPAKRQGEIAQAGGRIGRKDDSPPPNAIRIAARISPAKRQGEIAQAGGRIGRKDDSPSPKNTTRPACIDACFMGMGESVYLHEKVARLGYIRKRSKRLQYSVPVGMGMIWRDAGGMALSEGCWEG